MNLRQLEYIIAVADLRSFSAAAAACFVSQPTLSGQVKKLEEDLGVTLFERTSKRVVPTNVGEEILRSARRVQREMNSMRDTAQSALDPLGGKFRLGSFPTLSSYLLPELAPAMTTAMPELKLILIEEKTDVLIEQLLQGRIDAALLALPVEHAFLHTEELFDDPFYLAVSKRHALSSREKVNQDELHNHPLLLLEEGHCLRDQSLELCQTLGVPEDTDVRATSLETLRQMVRANTGVTLMPKIAMNDTNDDVRYIPFAPEAPYRRIGLAWRKTCSRMAVVEKTMELVRELKTA